MNNLGGFLPFGKKLPSLFTIHFSLFTENGKAVFHSDIIYKIIIYYKKYIAIFNNICYNIPCIII